jgi:hypothetical protein
MSDMLLALISSQRTLLDAIEAQVRGGKPLASERGAYMQDPYEATPPNQDFLTEKEEAMLAKQLGLEGTPESDEAINEQFEAMREERGLSVPVKLVDGEDMSFRDMTQARLERARAQMPAPRTRKADGLDGNDILKDFEQFSSMM